jgi:hypothetical protein
MKVIINSCYGGFSVNESVASRFGIEDRYAGPYDSESIRTHAGLIALIESGKYEDETSSSLEVIEIPDNYGYFISEYDGYESVTLKPRKSEVIRLASDVESLVEYLEGCNAF